MANVHANNYTWRKNARVNACCDVDPARAKAFAERHKIPKVYTDYRELLADPDIDAVSNVTSDPAHCEVGLAALAARKHILSEKPLASNLAQARKMAAAAKEAGVINMVNFSYRNASALHAASRLVADGKIGRVMHVESSYLQGWLSMPYWGDWRKTPGGIPWRLLAKHCQGTLGDIGCHILDMTSCIAGDIVRVQAELAAFLKGLEGERIEEYANDSFAAMLRFAGGGLGVLHSSRWASGQINSLRCRVYGDKGGLEVDLDRSQTSYLACLGKSLPDKPSQPEWKEYKAGNTPNMYERFIRAIRSGKNDASDFQNGLKVQACLDACFASYKKGGKPVDVVV
jgi:predicted dehydrogenase